MLVIRFLRVGKKNQPSFKIVVVDKKRSSKSGRFLEEVGFCNPLTKEKVLKAERIKYWLSVGVKPSPTVHNLLVKEKIIEGKKIPVHKKAKKKAAPEGGEPRPESSGREEKPTETKPTPEAKTPAPNEPPAGKEKPPEKTSEEKPTEKKETEVASKVEPPKGEKLEDKKE